MNYLLRRRKLGRTSCREVAEYSTTGLEVFRNDGFKFSRDHGRYLRRSLGLPTDGSLPIRDVDFVFRYGCTSHVPEGTIVNTVDAIHKVNNKTEFRLETAARGLAPRSWRHPQELIDAGYDEGPVVVRPSQHAQGRDLYVCDRYDKLMSAWRRIDGDGYISQLIDKVSEYRVFIAQSRVVWVAKKTPGNPEDVAWNVAQGGRFDNVRWSEWPLDVIEKALGAFFLSELDFGGVDVMVDRDGCAYVLEINSAPSQTSPYRQQCTAKAFDYIVRNGKERIRLGMTENAGYKNYIHPALTEQPSDETA